MSVNESGNSAEIVGGVVHTTIVVGTSQVEAKVGANRRDGRQMLRLYNDSSNTIFFGATGVTISGTTKGEPLEKKQWVNIPASDTLALFLIAGSAGNNVIVSEWS